MNHYAEIHWDCNPPRIDIPRQYNACCEFIDRNLDQGRREKIALIDDTGSYTYGQLADRIDRASNALLKLGVRAESKVLLCLTDTIDFPTVFWAVLRLGAIAIPVNTMLTSKDYDYILNDSRATTLVLSEDFFDTFRPILRSQTHLRTVVVSGKDNHGQISLTDAMNAASTRFTPAQTTADDIAFWLYTSGSTGTPKGSIHLHRDLVVTAALYGVGVLGMGSDDVGFSAAKMFFAYGLGNSMSFPFYVGATAVVTARKPSPEVVMALIEHHSPSIFFAVPTLYGALLTNPASHRANCSAKLRLCVSAGEALPARIGENWEERFEVPVLDGLGSTEMLHIFLSNRPDDVRYGSAGKPVPGYELKLLTDNGAKAAPGEPGELWVKGDSSAVSYWNQREKSLNTFNGRWTRTGDKYSVDDEGYYYFHGRTDEMLKVGGQWVSPFEVESALTTHPHVLEAAVVARADDDGLIKPMAYLVVQQTGQDSQELSDEIKRYVKEKLAPFKYPRWIQFVDDLPRTATGKVQRFKLREQNATDLS